MNSTGSEAFEINTLCISGNSREGKKRQDNTHPISQGQLTPLERKNEIILGKNYSVTVIFHVSPDNFTWDVYRIPLFPVTFLSCRCTFKI